MRKTLKSALQKTALASVLGIMTMAGASAQAASVSATVQVNAFVNPVCRISATNVAFGTVALSTSGTATATGSVTSTCTKKTAYTVAIDGGASSNIASRTMGPATAGNTDVLAYNLYLDSAFTKLWGDGQTAGEKLADIGTGTSQTATIYAQLPLNQFVQSDAYSDTLTVTLNY